MRLWLGMANRVAGSLRGQTAAQSRWQVQAVVAEAVSPAAAKTRPARRR